MEIILRNYSLNEDEKRCLPLYKKIIGMSFYPNVMLWIYLLRNGKYVDIRIIAAYRRRSK